MDEDYRTYRKILRISNEQAKSYLLLKTIHIGRDKNPFSRINDHMTGTTSTNFDDFCKQCVKDHRQLHWVYVKFTEDANSFYGTFEVIAIQFVESFGRPELQNSILGEKIAGTNVYSGFDDTQRQTIMRWIMDQPTIVKQY